METSNAVFLNLAMIFAMSFASVIFIVTSYGQNPADAIKERFDRLKARKFYRREDSGVLTLQIEHLEIYKSVFSRRYFYLGLVQLVGCISAIGILVIIPVSFNLLSKLGYVREFIAPEYISGIIISILVLGVGTSLFFIFRVIQIYHERTAIRFLLIRASEAINKSLDLNEEVSKKQRSFDSQGNEAL